MNGGRFNQMLPQLCCCMTRHDEKGTRFNPMLWAFTFVYCNMTLHDDRSGFNQMLLDLRFCMRLQDDTADCEGGEVLIKCSWSYAFL